MPQRQYLITITHFHWKVTCSVRMRKLGESFLWKIASFKPLVKEHYDDLEFSSKRNLSLVLHREVTHTECERRPIKQLAKQRKYFSSSFQMLQKI